MSAEPITVLGGEMHLMGSKSTGRQYRITVSLPLGYGKAPDEPWPFNNTPEKWPVVYVLDGNWYSQLITEIIRPMAWCGSTTDAIVVGIGYPEDKDPIQSFWESFLRRDHDLTPVRDEAQEKLMTKDFKRPVPNGDGGNFLKFIKDELVPFVEQTYRADPAKRTLVGHSYGSLLGLLALFEAPELFSTLVMGSPTMSYGNRVMFQREEAFAKGRTKLPVRIFLFMAELEESVTDTTLTDTLRLATLLQSRNYEGFILMKQIFLDQNHCEVAGAGFQWGMKMALRK